jgi:lysophospholipid acyltransferase (LPLAT)-like uncharacterized protein
VENLKSSKFYHRLGTYIALKLVDLIMSTCQVRTHGLDSLICSFKSRPTLFALWHDRLALAPFALVSYIEHASKVYAAISKSSDGDWVQGVMDQYPNTISIRIAHNQRQKAFGIFIDCLKNNHPALLMTPDGPRGPAYKVKPGIIVAAKETGAPIISFNWNGPHYKLSSWDHFRIPKPFSKIDLYFSKPLTLSSSSTLLDDQLLLEKILSS